MAPEVQRLLAEIRALPLEDREAIVRSVSASLSGESGLSPVTPQAADEAYQKALLAAGLIREIRPRRRDEQAFEFSPLEIQGEPLSRRVRSLNYGTIFGTVSFC